MCKSTEDNHQKYTRSDTIYNLWPPLVYHIDLTRENNTSSQPLFFLILPFFVRKGVQQQLTRVNPRPRGQQKAAPKLSTGYTQAQAQELSTGTTKVIHKQQQKLSTGSRVGTGFANAILMPTSVYQLVNITKVFCVRECVNQCRSFRGLAREATSNHCLFM